MISILEPRNLVGRSASFAATIEAPSGELTSIEAVIEQDGRQLPLFSLDRPSDGEVRQESSDRVLVTRTFDRTSHPELSAGEARILVSATRPVLWGLREATSTAEHVVMVRLGPAQVTSPIVVSLRQPRRRRIGSLSRHSTRR